MKLEVQRFSLQIFCICLCGIASPASAEEFTKEFIYLTAPFPQCHASTIEETSTGVAAGGPRGLVAAWFGGTHEKHPDVGIWFSRRTENGWTKPVEVANGIQDDSRRHPCWNPVLFQMPGGPLLLFYKVGPSPQSWWGMLIRSTDGGQTWSKPTRLPQHIFGPIKNKPVLLDDGRLLCGASTEHDGWRVHLEWTKDGGANWSRTESLAAPSSRPGRVLQAIQPTILNHGKGRLQILCRSRGLGKIVESSSTDHGRTWTPLKPTDLPNPSSGIDAVTLKDGRHLLVYNPTTRGRTPLTVAISSDGRQWRDVLVLEDEPGEYSYPAVIQTREGKVHITYTWKRRRIRHIAFDPNKLAKSQRP